MEKLSPSSTAVRFEDQDCHMHGFAVTSEEDVCDLDAVDPWDLDT